jgi:DtxR family Mn-dependent transcriptional regulator
MVSASLEDYLEAIYGICKTSPVARVKEIAARLEVTNASVVGALRSLREKGLVEQERYGYIRLTKSGRELARDVSNRHQALADFFHQVLGLGRGRAEQDACKAEHTLAAETIGRLILLKEFLGTQASPKQAGLDGFRKFIHEKE